MTSMNRPLFGLLIGGLMFTGSAYAVDPLDQLMEESRAAVRDFAGALMAEVNRAAEAGGPLNVITVCNQVAPGLGAKYSQQHQMSIERTALKFRSPANIPDAWERSVMLSFLERSQNEPLQGMEHGEIRVEEGRTVFRYMMAIPTAQQCLACHGTEIPAPITRKLDRIYPTDTARGFQAGEMRGAFTIRREL